VTEFLVLSVHDFRSRRKTSVHFITRELARKGHTRFFSVGLSRLSEYRGDTRFDLRDRANMIETVDGVECALWRRIWHPFRLNNPRFHRIEKAMFHFYRQTMSSLLRRWIRNADAVFVESGMAAIFIPDIRRLNPKARIIYLASDDLETIGCANTIKSSFSRYFDQIDLIRLPSRFLLEGLPHGRSSIFAPHGIDRSIAQKRYESPYGTRLRGVSVGSMLFDPEFFNIAAAERPDIDFHVIGAGQAVSGLHALKNIIVHNEMPFEQTLPYLQHANFGIAPYRDAGMPRYLLDTSLKLRQFGLFGLPAVCPGFAVGDQAGRFGYQPGDTISIAAAIDAACSNTTPVEIEAPSWEEIVDRLLHPEAYPEFRFAG